MKLFIDDELEEITRNVNLILATPKGSCPLNRGFGLDATFLDSPLSIAKGSIRVEIMEQIEKYEPRAKVKAISFEMDPSDGVIKPNVKLEFKNI